MCLTNFVRTYKLNQSLTLISLINGFKKFIKRKRIRRSANLIINKLIFKLNKGKNQLAYSLRKSNGKHYTEWNFIGNKNKNSKSYSLPC
jgi:hypothetical protein